MMDEDQLDCLYVNFVTPPFVDCESVAREFGAISQTGKKPIVCNYMTDKERWTGTTKILKDAGIPCFDFAETAAKALAAMVRYHKIRSRDPGEVKLFKDIDKDAVKKIIDQAIARKQEVLTAEEVYGILEGYRIPVADWGIARHSSEAVTLAEKIGFPVVVKADSKEIIHKTDVGGVAVNLKDGEDVAKAIEGMQNKLGKADLKFLVQKYMAQSIELIISAKKEEDHGHLVMFGMGGIFVEIYKDVVFNLTPVSNAEADEMLSTIKAVPLLNDFRGRKGIDKTKVSEILQRISSLVVDFPVIKELDLNPILAYQDKVCAVDARIIL